ncbi:PAS domain S-box protein [Lunatimonas salinarum]|uniref:PAS domain S-box protein n=1 Tax=Lunatimonas salinarum TaxID=1774590 RepID=UPI001ADEE01F|nr:PAS domain S-box protein [Lunatimonas salinarum]
MKNDGVRSSRNGGVGVGTTDLPGKAKNQQYDFFTKMAARICQSTSSILLVEIDGNQEVFSAFGMEGLLLSEYRNLVLSLLGSSNSTVAIPDGFMHLRQVGGLEPAILQQIGFFVGVPLLSEAGVTIGSLSVTAPKPQILRDAQIRDLEDLAGQLIESFERHRQISAYAIREKKLLDTLRIFREGQQINKLGVWELDITTGKTEWTEEVYRIHEVPIGFDHNQVNGVDFYHPDDRPLIERCITSCIEAYEPFDVTCRLIAASGKVKWVRATGKRVNGTLLGAFQDISEIKEQEWKYKGIFNSSFSFIGMLNTDGILLDSNDTSLHAAGIEREDVIGKYFWDCYWWQISETTQQELKQHFKKALTGVEVTYEVSVWARMQTPVTILFSLKPIKDASGNVIFIIPEGRPIQDIVDTRNRYKALIESTSAGTFEWNIDTEEVLINDQYAEMLGYTVDELRPFSARKWEEIIDRGSFNEAKKHLISCLKKERAFFQLELPLVHKLGHLVWVNVRGKVIEWTESGRALKFYGTNQNITERKRKEEEAKYQQNILNALYELSPIGISLIDYYTGRFVDVNRKMLEPTGYTKEEFLQLTNFDLTPEEYLPMEREVIQRMKVDGRYAPFEKAYFRKDGSRYPVLLQGVMIRDLKGRKLIWSFTEDISLKKQTESKVKELHELAKEQNERLRNFSFIVSHNLRSHSGGLTGLIDLLKSINPEYFENEVVSMIEAGVNNLKQTIQDLTEIIQVNLDVSVKVDQPIRPLVQKTLDSLSALIAKECVSVENAVSSSLTVPVIPAYMQSIILNFVTNAIKYKAVDRDSYLRIYSDVDQDRVHLYFEDNGLGIDLKKYGTDLFGMYKTFHRHQDSRGVGLFLTKSQIESMGGSVAVYSEVGKGTTFQVSLPLRE